MRIIGQTNIGISILDAMDDLAERMLAKETLMMARVMRVQSQTGGDLAKALEQLAATIKRASSSSSEDFGADLRGKTERLGYSWLFHWHSAVLSSQPKRIWVTHCSTRISGISYLVFSPSWSSAVTCG